MNKNDQGFIGYAIAECAKKGVTVILENNKYLQDEDGSKMSGYFNEGSKILSVATKMAFRSWFCTFVHEFAHFQQWVEKEKIFMKLSNNVNLDADIWDWINGKKIPKIRVNKSIEAYQQMELDAERRALNIIDKFSLSINKKLYIKNANVYVLLYGVMKSTRVWLDDYPEVELSEYVPDTLITDFTIPRGFLEEVLNKNK